MKTLQILWHAWKRFGQYIGDMIARVVLTVFYFTLFVPFGLAVRNLADPLDIRSGVRAQWLERNTDETTFTALRRLS